MTEDLPTPAKTSPPEWVSSTLGGGVVSEKGDRRRDKSERPTEAKTGSLDGITNLVKTTTHQQDQEAGENKGGGDTTSQTEK